MRRGCSAYLSIYNDWDILADALETIAPYVEEIVLVDGAYTWMAPYFAATGIDPTRSDRRVIEAAGACGVPLRIINGLWNSEVEKRIAGYEACRGPFVFRIDADELLLMHGDRLDAFFAGNHAVAQMEMPVLAAPGLIEVSGPDSAVQRQSLLFDKRQIGAAAHLHYLWLVLGPEALPDVTEPLPPVHAEPIAFNSHLTRWRTPATALYRASFYTLNYTRVAGMPWTGWGRDAPVRDLTELFDKFVSPAVYQDLLMTSQLVVGEADPTGLILREAPYGTGSNPAIRRLYGQFVSSLAELNRCTATSGRHFVNGDYILIDLTTAEAVAALTATDIVVFVVPAEPALVKAKMLRRFAASPWETLETLATTTDGERITVTLPARASDDLVIRQILRLQIWCRRPGPIHWLGVHTGPS